MNDTNVVNKGKKGKKKYYDNVISAISIRHYLQSIRRIFLYIFTAIHAVMIMKNVCAFKWVHRIYDCGCISCWQRTNRGNTIGIGRECFSRVHATPRRVRVGSVDNLIFRTNSNVRVCTPTRAQARGHLILLVIILIVVRDVRAVLRIIFIRIALKVIKVLSRDQRVWRFVLSIFFSVRDDLDAGNYTGTQKTLVIFCYRQTHMSAGVFP